MPRGLNRCVSMCIDSGVWLMKSKMRFGSWRKVTGSGFSEWMTSGNLIASRMKKTGEVVADEIPVAVLGVELHREAARIARDLRRVAAADDGREADRERRLLALLLEQLRARVLRRRLVADLAGRLELAVADEAARVHDALGDPLAVEVADLLEEVIVLQRRRAAAADRPLRLVVGDRVTLPRRQRPIRPCSGRPFSPSCSSTAPSSRTHIRRELATDVPWSIDSGESSPVDNYYQLHIMRVW